MESFKVLCILRYKWIHSKKEGFLLGKGSKKRKRNSKMGSTEKTEKGNDFHLFVGRMCRCELFFIFHLVFGWQRILLLLALWSLPLKCGILTLYVDYGCHLLLFSYKSIGTDVIFDISLTSFLFSGQ